MNINDNLLYHFQHGEGAAKYLRNRIVGLDKMLRDFFGARSDIKRIIESEKLAEIILATMEYQEILSLRKEVASLEIKRIIKYSKQNDHTAHTVYLFLLGIWMYDNINPIRIAVNSKIESHQKEKMFVFQWIFSSLLHDIGYLYYEKELIENETTSLFTNNHEKNISGNSKKPAYQVFGAYYDKLFLQALNNEFFNFSWTTSTEEIQEAKYELNLIWTDFKERFQLIETRNANSPEEVLNILANVPWLNEILNPDKNLNGFDYLTSPDIKVSLSDNAYKIAKEGYKKDTIDPRVDHAIASGLMLLQYTSIWYWLSEVLKNKAENETEPKYKELYKELYSNFHYPKTVLEHFVIPACKTAIYHNINDKDSITLESEPLLYLAILCDELQVWDRFVAGSAHLSVWENAETHCMAENVIASTEPEQTYVSFGYEYERFRHKVKGTLDKRLLDWKKYVKL